MKKIGDYKFIILLVIFTILAVFFPLTGDDLFYFINSVTDFGGLLNLSPNGLLTNMLLTILVKYKLLRIITYGIVGTSLFLVIRNTVNKNNNVLLFIAMFLMFMLDRSMLSASFVQATGFVNHFIGALFVILFINIINKNLVLRMHPLVLMLLGFVGASINPVYAILLFVIIFVYMLTMFKDKYTKGFLPLMIGIVFGIVIMVLNSNFVYTGYAYNLLHEFIPRVVGSNFLITLVLSALILFLSIKVFMRGNKLITGLSMIGILVYLFASLLSDSYIWHYILYVIAILSSFYILSHINTSRMFKRKLILYFGCKCLFIILSCLFGYVYDGSLLFIYLIDIILILELYNYLLPSNFLELLWILVVVLIGFANIYIYKNIFYKYIEMNNYITNKLECSYGEFMIPFKYENDYLYKYIPQDDGELEWYLQYYDIDIYNKDRKIELKFRE